jgi:hypothetical protein
MARNNETTTLKPAQTDRVASEPQPNIHRWYRGGNPIEDFRASATDSIKFRDRRLSGEILIPLDRADTARMRAFSERRVIRPELTKPGFVLQSH